MERLNEYNLRLHEQTKAVLLGMRLDDVVNESEFGVVVSRRAFGDSVAPCYFLPEFNFYSEVVNFSTSRKKAFAYKGAVIKTGARAYPFDSFVGFNQHDSSSQLETINLHAFDEYVSTNSDVRNDLPVNPIVTLVHDGVNKRFYTVEALGESLTSRIPHMRKESNNAHDEFNNTVVALHVFFNKLREKNVLFDSALMIDIPHELLNRLIRFARGDYNHERKPIKYEILLTSSPLLLPNAKVSKIRSVEDKIISMFERKITEKMAVEE